MQINVIMPTYNDSKTITSALDSLKNQTYKNWHLYIINDGSTDNTEKIVTKYIKENNLNKQITYLYEENKDQLNAIKYALTKIENTKSLIYTLHSDDVMDNDNVFKHVINYFKKNDVDAIISGFDIINEKGNIVGYQSVKKYKKSQSTLALQTLWLGRNLYSDVAFFKTDIYIKYVYNNYLTWNTPFWINYEDGKACMLDVKNVDFKFFKYRVFEENYINNEIGLLNVLNGELRNELNLLKHFDIPLYKFQYLLFRVFNKLHLNYYPLYKKRESNKKYEIIKFIINKRIPSENVNKYPYYESILNFFKNYRDREIKLEKISDKEIYLGSDVRKFNKDMLNNKLPKIYYSLFKEMDKGFNAINIDNRSYDNLVNILKFLDIYNYIELRKDNNEK